MAIYVRFSNEHVERYLHSNVQMHERRFLYDTPKSNYEIVHDIPTNSYEDFFYEYISDVLIEKVIIMQNNVCT